jgi:uncharacterized protein (TIGR00297 family)
VFTVMSPGFDRGEFGMSSSSPFRMSNLHLLYGSVLVLSGRTTAAYSLLTAVFSLLGWGARGVTARGALSGAIACFALLWAAGLSGFAALLAVFLVTWISTRLGYDQKQRLGTAEGGSGRNACQVLANLGTASVCAVLYATAWQDRRLLAGMAAALAEAAADTVSSEIGQAVGGTPCLVTTWQRAAPGTNGAITWLGTLAGIAAAVLVAIICGFGHIIGWSFVPICAGAAVVGMIADSLLGATLERDRLLGNNGVNFISTVISALLALLISGR